MFEKIIQNERNKFYPIKKDAIANAQKELGIIIPSDLADFYSQVGYGFIGIQNCNYNRIMDPQSVCEFRFRTGQFADSYDLDIYEPYERNELFFFEICEGLFISIGFSGKNKGKIIFDKKVIANSLEEFLIKYQENERYFEI